MSLCYYEEIKRAYSNGVTIVYELIDSDNLYIHSIISINKKKGNATESLNDFLQKFNKKNIYIFSSFELGTDKEILDKWYNKLGFVESRNVPNIPYNITHLKKAEP